MFFRITYTALHCLRDMFKIFLLLNKTYCLISIQFFHRRNDTGVVPQAYFVCSARTLELLIMRYSNFPAWRSDHFAMTRATRSMRAA